MRMVLPHQLLMEPLCCQQMLLECTLTQLTLLAPAAGSDLRATE